MISGTIDMGTKRIASGHRRRTARWLAGLVAGLLAIGLLAPDSGMADSRYTPARKLGRGLSNMGLGVAAIPGQMTKETRERGAAIGLPLGFVKGIGWFVASEAVGVWEFLTCPFEFPREFKPILEPEFPWQYFEDGR